MGGFFGEIKEEKRDKPKASVIRDYITDPVTGERRMPYARMPVRFTPKGCAMEFARKAMLERYGAEPDKYDDMQAAVFEEIQADYLAGFETGYKRGRFDERYEVK